MEDPLTSIARSSVVFAGNIYTILSPNEGNLCFSPISLHAVLSLSFCSSNGRTSRALRKCLELSNAKITATGYKELLTILRDVEGVELRLAHNIFMKDEHKMCGEFSSKANTYFYTTPECASFSNRSSGAKTINAWMEKATDKKIKDIVAPSHLDGTANLIFVNGIYFSGKWMSKFETQLTKVGKFYITPEKVVSCKMMHGQHILKYVDSASLNAHVVSIPYKNKDVSLTIIVPKATSNIKEVEKKLLRRDIFEVHDSLHYAEIILTLPKFNIDTSVLDMNEPLQQLGLTDIFNETSDFHKMFSREKMAKVGKVLQKVNFGIGEQGTAGSTLIKRQGSMFELPPDVPKYAVCADHPFIYFVAYHDKCFCPLVVGRFVKPT